MAAMAAMAASGAPALGEPWPVQLMNTVWADRRGVHDTLDDPEQARTWFERAARGVGAPVPDAVDDDARSRLRALRDALRRLAADITADDRSGWTSPIADIDEAVAVVNRATADAPTWTALERNTQGRLARVTRSAGPAPLAVVGTLAEQAVDLLTGPEDLRACRAPGCVLYFVRQHPRREWCSTGCGNRARVARHYRRHHGRQFE